MTVCFIVLHFSLLRSLLHMFRTMRTPLFLPVIAVAVVNPVETTTLEHSRLVEASGSWPFLPFDASVSESGPLCNTAA